MGIKIEKINKDRLRSSNITVVISISLVLFLIGLIGMLAINARSYIDYLKEQMVIEVFFKNSQNSNTAEREQSLHLLLLDSIMKNPFVKQAKYTSKQEATKIAKRDLGVDSEVLYENDIFPASITVTLKPEYTDSLHISNLNAKLKENRLVDETQANGILLAKMNESVNKITFGISVLAIIILIISISLINNSIHLKIYANRFLIKTMQLVGARRFFIMKPFLKQALILGLIGGAISLVMLFSLNYLLIHYNILPPIIDYSHHILLAFFVLILGMIITTISTWVATWRFLQLKLTNLYY